MDLAQLADVSLLSPNETSHRLGDYWADRTVVLVFLRHFG